MRRLSTLPSSLLISLLTLFFVAAGSSPPAYSQSTAVLQGRVLAEVRMTAAFGKALLFVLLATLALFSPSIASGAESPKRVLIISSVDANLPAIVIMNQAIRTKLKTALPARVQIYNEVQDEFQIPNDKYAVEMVSMLRRKYEGEKLDLIITLSSPALKFLLKYQRELFPDIPIVFLTEDQSEVAGLSLGSNVTGVWGTTDLAPTLDTMLALHPETERVVVVAGSSPYDKFWMTKAQNDLRSYESKVGFTYLTDLTIQKLRQELGSQPKKNVVLFLSFMVDSAGHNFSAPEALSLVAPTSSAPLYALSETELGHGVVGGSMISYEALGTRAAELGLRVLAGEKPQDIPQQTLPSIAMFDWRQLRRWGIDEAKLPAGTVVRFKELTVWGLYKWHIIGAISLILVQALGIAWLLFTQTKRRQAEKRSARFALLAESEHQHLDEIVANVPGIVWEAKLEAGDPIPKITFVSPYLGKMLGYTAAEWLSTPSFWLSVVVEEDREQAKETFARVLESGEDGIAQARYRTKDGRVLWVEAYLTAIRDENGKPVGLRGVAMDISDRKDAEEALRESEAQFRNLADTAPVMIWIADTDMLSTFFNQPVLDFTGRSMEELLGDGWSKGVPEEDYQKCVEIYTAAYERKERFVMEYRMRHADGEFRWIYETGVPRFASNGEFIGYIGSSVDITDRKATEEALQIAHEEVNKLKNKLEEENIYLREEIKLAHNFNEIVGRSDATKYVLYKIEQVAPTDTTVLITGETGTGKELVAHAIHGASPRRERPLVKVNCAALTPTLIESELFGHEKGAFTGATARRIGRFELANGATIFLDEIGELPLELQGKLLRVIQEGEFERLGSAKTIKVDARIIAATNRNLKIAVEQGSFREDLWYRLNVFPITVPPLRDRKGDIPVLVEHFVRRFCQKVGRKISSISPGSLRILQDYAWPGNVRELANVLERAVINTSGTVLRVVDHFETPYVAERPESDKTLEEMEKEYIIRILDNTGWRIEGRRGAARILGLNPSTLRTRMAKLGIQKTDQNQSLASSAR